MMQPKMKRSTLVFLSGLTLVSTICVILAMAWLYWHAFLEIINPTPAVCGALVPRARMESLFSQGKADAVTAPIQPVSWKGQDLDGDIEDLFVQDPYLYLLIRSTSISQLVILDVSQPDRPKRLGQVEIPTKGIPHGILLIDNYAYVGGAEGTWIVDVSNPDFPMLVGFFDVGHPRFKEDQYLYLTRQRCNHNNFYGIFRPKCASALYIVDTTKPAAPHLVNCYEKSGSLRGLAIAGNLAYLSIYQPYVRNENPQLIVLDISNPKSPTEVHVYQLDDIGSIAVVNHYVYITDQAGGVNIVNFSEPTEPQKIGSLNLPGSGYRIEIIGRYAYIVSVYHSNPRLRIVDISNPGAPLVVGSYTTEGRIGNQAVAGHYVYMIELENLYKGGLRILDISNPGAPTTVDFQVQP